MAGVAVAQQPLYPGVLRMGDRGEPVKRVQQRLNAVGCGPIAEDGDFGPQTYDAVQLFQARSVDSRGNPLQVDGQVGPLTWAALFRTTLPPTTAFYSPLAELAMKKAATQVGVLEQPPGSNQGPEVNQYLRAVGLDSAGHYPWCAAFVYWCFARAAEDPPPRPNPLTRTGSVLEHWQKAAVNPAATRFLPSQFQADPGCILPGMIFVLATSGGAGHTGLVEVVDGHYLTTIEGNTNEGGSREGIGVFRRTSRKLAQINRGFIGYR